MYKSKDPESFELLFLLVISMSIWKINHTSNCSAKGRETDYTWIDSTSINVQEDSLF